MVANQETTALWRVPGVEQISDEALASEALRDARQFDALYRRYVDPVFRYCNRSLPIAAAEDATSITFLKALQSLSGFDRSRGTFRSWIFAIARNVTLDQLRARQHIQIDQIEIASRGPTVEDQAIEADRRNRLSEALRQLPPDQQDVIALRLANLTSPEIAAVLGKRAGTVRTLQHRAVTTLRQLLGAESQTVEMSEGQGL